MSASSEQDVPLLFFVIAGCVSGGIETTATWPIEYIKTQLQLQKKAQAKPEGDALHNYSALEEGQKDEAANTPPPYTDMISGILYTIRTFGFWTLYQGLMPALLGSIPKAGIRFGLDVWFDLLLQDKNGHLSILAYLLAGLAAGIVEALVIVAPVETIKTKCIELNMAFLQGLGHILSTQGIQGIYKGVFATVLKQGSNVGLRFLWYHEYKRIVLGISGSDKLSILESFVGGMTAGIFSAFMNQPFDVLKTRLQGVHAGECYTSTWDCVIKTFQSEGIAGFYRGIVPRLARVVPGQGIIFMSFEAIVNILVAVFGV